MRKNKNYKGFLLVECLIGIVILAVLGTFILPTFQNMWQNSLRSERKVSLLFHSENIAENLLALYNLKSSPVPDLKYHDLDIVLLLEALKRSDDGDVVHRVMTVYDEEVFLDIRVIEKNDMNIQCLSTMKFSDVSEELGLNFMLSSVGR